VRRRVGGTLRLGPTTTVRRDQFHVARPHQTRQDRRGHLLGPTPAEDETRAVKRRGASKGQGTSWCTGIHRGRAHAKSASGRLEFADGAGSALRRFIAAQGFHKHDTDKPPWDGVNGFANEAIIFTLQEEVHMTKSSPLPLLRLISAELASQSATILLAQARQLRRPRILRSASR